MSDSRPPLLGRYGTRSAIGDGATSCEIPPPLQRETSMFVIGHGQFPAIQRVSDDEPHNRPYEATRPRTSLPAWFIAKMMITALTGLPLGGVGSGMRKGGERSPSPSVVVCHGGDTAGSGGGGGEDDTDGRVHVRVREARAKMGCLRLLIFTLFVALYLTAMTLSNDAEKTSPIVEQARIRLFPEAEEAIEDMIQQEFTKSLTEFMPGPDVAQSLNSIQSKCRRAALQTSEQMAVDFKCDIIKVEISGLNPAAFPHMPCQDNQFISEAVVFGDLEPYHEIPTALKMIYKTHNVSAEDQFHGEYDIGQGYPFFAPLMNTENDKENGSRLGPIPTLNMKLNALATSLGIAKPDSVFLDDPWDFEQASAHPRSPPRPQPGETVASVHRNHHWDVAFHCEPEEIVVSFKVTTRRAEVPLWWRFRLQWTATGRHLNFYRSALHVKTGLSFTYRAPEYLLVPLVAAALFVFCYFLPALITLLSLPYNFFVLYAKRGVFKHNIRNLVDCFNVRVLFTPWFNVLVENVGVLFSIIGFITSGILVFSSNSAAAYYDDEVGVKVSPFQFWRSHLQVSTSQLVLQVLFGFWADGGWHAAALVVYFLRLLEYSMMFEGTSFILMTFLFAFFPVLHFCCIFAVLLLSFAVILFSGYGRIYTQYSSLRRCLWNILLYTFSFGDASKAEYLINPQIEKSAVSLQLVLLAFQIIVVIIFLNMFTTIVIDAYNVACDRASSAVKMRRLQAALWYRAKVHFGYMHQVQEEIDILGGKPGAIFFRATVPDDENPLGLVKDKVDPAEIVQKLEEALQAVKPTLPQLSETRGRLDSKWGDDLTANIWKSKHFGEDGPLIIEEGDEYRSLHASDDEGTRRGTAKGPPNDADGDQPEAEPLLRGSNQ